jgi:uncharacterized protein YndB with AHSA1/START domain
MLPVENIIDRRLTFKAPLEKVWKAIGTPEGIKGWFTCTVQGEWKEGSTVSLVWPSGNTNEIIVTSLKFQEEMAYKWHPGDYGDIAKHPESELTTVTMRLRAVGDQTELHLTETGFENIPDDRKLRVLGLNVEGWDEELENIRKYVEA